MDIFRLAMTKKVVKDDSVGEVVEEYAVANIDSAVGTWVFNKSVSKFDSVVEFGITGTATSGDYTVNVKSIKNGVMSSGSSYYFLISAAPVGGSYGAFFRQYGAWEYNDGSKWYNISDPPTLTITGGTDVNNAEFLELLKANATKQSEEIPANATTITYDGEVIASLEPGQTETIPCAGKKMRTNITVQVSEQEASGGGGVEIPLRTVTYEISGVSGAVLLRYATVENGALIVKETRAINNSTGSITLVPIAGCYVESEPIVDSWSGEEMYPTISLSGGDGSSISYYVNAGSDFALQFIHESDFEWVEHLVINTFTGGW